MINKKQYLKNLLIVKRNLQIFLKAMKDNNQYDYFSFHTLQYLEKIEMEISYLKRELENEDKEFYSSLYTIYDFGA